ncbi:MAG: VWA domain-containing protein [Acidobacteria bacterium]|nr:MAG: VWA domain-containing protein [Acidobacteriota bacterium]
MRWRVAVIGAAVAAAFAPVRAQQGATFKSNVNMLAIDAVVVDREGQPILGLLPEDFTVSVNNKPRRVVSANLVQYSTEPTFTNLAPAPVFTPGRVPDDGRLFVLAVDDASFLPGAVKPAMASAKQFLRNLRPSDMVGLYVFPFERPQLDMTHDHRAVEASLDRIIGRRDMSMGSFGMTVSEVVDITSGDSDTLQRVVRRECNLAEDPHCPDEIRAEASAVASYYEAEAAQRVYGFGQLVQGLQGLPGHKTLVILSGGMASATRIGGRPDVQGFMRRLGEQAARANVALYVIHMDNTFMDAFAVNQHRTRDPASRFMSLLNDETVVASGLERLANEAGGVYFSVKAGSGDRVFGRVLRETMAYYLLGVEPTQEDWDGRKLMVKVKTTAKGAAVRAVREIIAK